MLEAFYCVALIGLVGQHVEKSAALAVLEKHWNDLAAKDQTRAALAALALAKSPRESTAFFKERLRPVKIDPKNVAKWLTDIDSDDLQTQTQAMENLEYCGKYIQSDLESALKRASDIETKQIIEQLRAKLPPVVKMQPGTSFSTSNGSSSIQVHCDAKGNVEILVNGVVIDWSKALGAPRRSWVRTLRAVAILEHFATPEARQVLESLAFGEADALPTVAARAALERRKAAVDQENLWAELANPDEGKTILAMLALAAKPKETIALIEKNLKPIKIDAKHVALLLSRLASGNFAVRNQAMQELESCGTLIRKNLEDAHKNATVLESKRRIEELLARLPKVVNSEGRGGFGGGTTGIDVMVNFRGASRTTVTINGSQFELARTPPEAQWVRATRALTILEHLGNEESRRLLDLITAGDSDAPPTIAARTALWRLSMKSPQQGPLGQPNKPIEPTPQQFQAAVEAFATIGGTFTKDTDWTTRRPVYIGSLHKSATDDDLKKVPLVPFSFGLSLAGQEKITDAGMANLDTVKNLCYLCLNSTNVTGEGLKRLSNQQDLSSLDLSLCKKITNVGVLADLKNLSALNFHGAHIGSSRLREISRLKGLRFLNVTFTDVNDADLREIVKLQNLSSLDVWQTMVTDDGISELAALPNLTYLHLGGEEVTDESLADIANITTLADLGLFGAVITDRGLRHIARLERLTNLGIGYTKVSDRGLKQIAALKKLRSLDLRSTPVTFAGLKELARLKELSFLSLSGAKAGDAELREIAKFANLSELSIADANVTDAGLKALADLEKLSSLDLSGAAVTCEGVLGANGFPSLTTLTLFSTGLTDAGLNDIVKLKKLTSLNLSQTKITDAGLKGIGNLANLQTLDVSGVKLTDEGLKHIALAARLKGLSLRDAKVTDAGVKEIVKLKELTSLDLGGLKITDSGMRELGKLTKLESLGLWDAKVSDKAIGELQRALPNCYIWRPE